LWQAIWHERHRVIEAGDGQELLDRFSQHEDASLIILDVMMPRKNALRFAANKAPFGYSGADAYGKRHRNDEVAGFNCGADEYIAKPFSPKILVTRVKSLLRRTAAGDLSDIVLGGLSIHYRERAAFIEGTQLTLTPREFDLLYYLVKNKNIVLSRDQILSGVWDADYAAMTAPGYPHQMHQNQRVPMCEDYHTEKGGYNLSAATKRSPAAGPSLKAPVPSRLKTLHDVWGLRRSCF
jgi:DNA-binding response OmpR family regulator